jgi:protein-disulfide isomerase
MASRKEQKERARAERLERERQLAAKAARRRRLQMIGGVVIVAVVVAVAAIAISSHGSANATASPTTPADVAASARVQTLLTGIPQSSDNVLGDAHAPVTITEYGDLECSVCDEFALAGGAKSPAGVPGTGIEDQLIDQYVKTGKVKLVYDSLQTATPSSSTFTLQQDAAYAAGLQDKAWDYVELFYNEQGQEDSGYVTMSYLEGLAKQVPGLNYAEWLRDVNDAKLTQQVESEVIAGTKADGGSPSTPTLVVSGPKGESAFKGITALSTLSTAITAAA